MFMFGFWSAVVQQPGFELDRLAYYTKGGLVGWWAI